jgi:hypothetical protein
MTETFLMQRVRAAIAHTGLIVLWRNNTGVDLERRVRYGLGNGSADLVGLVRGSGRFFALEIKTPTGRLSKDQEAWGSVVRKKGGFCAVVRSEAEALAAVGRAARGGVE